MFKYVIFTFVLYFSFFDNSFGQSTDFNKFANTYFDDIAKTGAPIFFSACKTENGKAVVIFNLDEKQGKIFNLIDNKVVNLASIVIKQKSISIDIENTQGGLYTYTIMENYVNDILNNSLFKFTLSGKINEVFYLTPNYICVDKPYNK